MAAQTPAGQRGRLGKLTAANMLRSMLPLVVMVLALAYFCTPHNVDPVAAIDPANSIRYAASVTEGDLLVPDLPETWIPTSVDVVAPEDGQAGPVTLTIGYVTPNDEFARYVVSTDPADDLIDDLLAGSESIGQQSFAGRRWQEYATSRTERLYLWEQGEGRVVVTGSASEDELRTLAESLIPYRD